MTREIIPVLTDELMVCITQGQGGIGAQTGPEKQIGLAGISAILIIAIGANQNVIEAIPVHITPPPTAAPAKSPVFSPMNT